MSNEISIIEIQGQMARLEKQRNEALTNEARLAGHLAAAFAANEEHLKTIEELTARLKELEPEDK